MSTKPILVVMAAGMGSRYGGLKQIDPVGPSGEAILDYSLYDARRAGFKTVVFIIKHEIEQAFKEAVGARAVRAGFEVRYAYQQLEKLPEGFTVPEGRVKPWGTAHAILVAEEAIGDAPFAVINADDYYGPQGFKLIYDYLNTHADGDRYAWAMVGFLLGNTVSANGSVSRGVCVTDESRNLVSVTERTCIEPYADGIHYSEDGGKSWADLPADCVVSMNLWGFTPAYVQEAKAGFAAFLQASLPVNPMKCEYYLPTVVTNALEAGTADVHVLTSADKWHGITYREDKPELVEALKKMSEDGLYPVDRLFRKSYKNAASCAETAFLFCVGEGFIPPVEWMAAAHFPGAVTTAPYKAPVNGDPRKNRKKTPLIFYKCSGCNCPLRRV